MKKILYFNLMLLLASCIVACRDEAQQYKDKLEKERKAITNYIKRNNIEVLKVAPENGIYGAKQFLKTSSGLYFRLENSGSGDDVRIGQEVLYRFYKITLDAIPDTITYNWSTNDYPNPAEFVYGRGYPSIAIQEAVGLMKKTNAQAQLIVPSALGFSSDYEAVRPYLFTLKIQLAD